MKVLAQKCPTCGSPTEVRRVEYLVPGTSHVVRLDVEAEVCTRCGQMLFEPETVERFEKIRGKLAAGDVSGFTPVGQAYRG